MSTSILVGTAVTQYVGIFTDSVSIAYGTGVDVCGARTFTISSTKNSASTSLSIIDLSISAAGMISLATATSTTLGTHTATVTVSLASYPLIVLTQTFVITIDPCIITGFSMNSISPASDQTYTVTFVALGWTVTPVTTQVPACGYLETFSSTNYPTFVTATLPGTAV
jgi:hypothetical protein